MAAALLGLELGTGRPAGAPPARDRSGPPPIVIVAAGPASGRSLTSSPHPLGPRGVSRAFIAAYVAFIYGRLGPSRLPGVSPYLRRQLEAQHPRPPAVVVAVADPRLRSLGFMTSGPARVRAVAVIEDGAAVYQVTLELRRLTGGWTITGLGETS